MVGRRGLLPEGVNSPADLAQRLSEANYLADMGVATAAYLALALPRPLFLEGEAGVGKTSLARAMAHILGAPLLRLQCYEGIDASQALYDWDFPRQLLHLRAAESAADVYWAGRLTLCATVDDERRYDVVFDASFGDRAGCVVRRQRVLVPKLQLVVGEEAAGDGTQEQRASSASAVASSEERLRHRDVATMTVQQK